MYRPNDNTAGELRTTFYPQWWTPEWSPSPNFTWTCNCMICGIAHTNMRTIVIDGLLIAHICEFCDKIYEVTIKKR